MEQLAPVRVSAKSIEFRLNIAPGLPRVGVMRSIAAGVLHCLHFAIESVESQRLRRPTEDLKTVRLEAREGTVQILIAHSGPGFFTLTGRFDPLCHGRRRVRRGVG